MGSWDVGWVGEAPGVGRDISTLRARALSLSEKESSNQRKLTFLLKKTYEWSCWLINICKHDHLKKMTKFMVAHKCSTVCVHN